MFSERMSPCVFFAPCILNTAGPPPYKVSLLHPFDGILKNTLVTKTHHFKIFPLLKNLSACSNGDRVTAVVVVVKAKESIYVRERECVGVRQVSVTALST